MKLSSRFILLLVNFVILFAGTELIVQANNLPENFERITVLSGLQEPDHLIFSPDGRMFISERVTGKLLIAKFDASNGSWILNPEPFHVFDVPKPDPRRSAGLRAIAFDPDFTTNGFVYAFYMLNELFQNRVVRLKADPVNPDVSDLSHGENGEELLIDIPFNSTFASGSHNGGALVFGTDGKLYISTGDGWTGESEGEPVQSLFSFTGKILVINSDGSIPESNPFFDQTVGDYRAIYSLGLRNPFSISRHPSSGNIYINEARGANKADIYIAEAGANYGHEGSEIGTFRLPWANASTGTNGVLITGGAWYPIGGPFPSKYHGVYFVPMWGENNEPFGQINYIQSESDTTVFEFETDINNLGSNGWPVKPIMTRIGPDGNLYYLLTTYLTDGGSVQMVRYTAQSTIITPGFTPNGGPFFPSVEVEIASETPDVEIRYTLDSSEPDESSALYEGAITISDTVILKAKAFKSGLNPSSVAAVLFSLDNTIKNIPPIVDAGPDQMINLGEVATLNGGGSTDPDGNDDLIYDESWTQLGGPPVTIFDAFEEVAYFTPYSVGAYTFQLELKDEVGASGSDTVIYTVIDPDNPTTILLQDDFEQYETGVDPFDWYDSAANNSTAEDDALFETMSIAGQVAFGTSSAESNIHSHYVGLGSEFWSNYRVTGRIRISSNGAGIGVTVLSDYPYQDAYYRIRRFDTNDFHLDPHGTTVEGDISSGVVPISNTWYQFIIEVEDTGGRTNIRAKVWPETDSEPSNWQIDAWDESATRLTSGTVGVWSYRSGNKYWDNLVVEALDELPSGQRTLLIGIQGDGAVDPSGGSYDQGSVVQLTAIAATGYEFVRWEGDLTGSRNPQNITLDTDKSVAAVFELLEPPDYLMEDFKQYGSGVDPFDWYDSAANNSTAEDDALFETMSIAGQVAFGTSSAESNIHSHYVGLGSEFWSNYRVTGRIRISSNGAGIGVTVLSDYPYQDAYYRIRRFDTNDFHLDPHGTTVEGDISSGVVPISNTWYQFIIEVEDTGGRTNIRAKVWPETDSEPSNWQIDAWDESATRLTEGTIGIWSFRSGIKFWDDLRVE